MRMECTKDIAVPQSLVFRGEKRFQLLHKWLEKRTCPCKEGAWEVANLGFGQLMEILLANLDGYHDETMALANISKLGSIQICK
jgi:hypothetical protein